MELPRYNKSCFKYLYLSYNLVNHSVVIAVIYLRGKKSSFDCRFCRGNEIAAGERAHRAEDTNYPIWKSSSQTPHLTLSLVWEHQKKRRGRISHNFTSSWGNEESFFCFSFDFSIFMFSFATFVVTRRSVLKLEKLDEQEIFHWCKFRIFLSSNSSKESFFE